MTEQYSMKARVAWVTEKPEWKVGNVIWLFITIGGFFCCTVIGVPIAKVYFRLAGVVGFPIGMQIEKVAIDDWN